MNDLIRPAHRRARWAAAVGFALFLVASVALSSLPLSAVLPGAWAAQQGGVRPMLPGDALLGPTRGSSAAAIAFSSRYGAQLPADVSAYINEVYRLAPQVGLDPAIVVAQSALETDTWRTTYWVNHRNPAGIGITFDGQSSFTWANGTDAARGHLVHLSLYASGPIPNGSPLRSYIPLDPRYQAAISAGYAGVARTIADLTGRWATDPIYDSKLTGRGNDILYRYRIVGLSGSANTTGAAAVDDASATTGWRTTDGTPASATLLVDLGQPVAIGRLRWLLGAPGVTDRLIIARSGDGAQWTTIGTYGSGPTGRWQGITPNVSARFIRFTIENPRQQPVLGTITEVQFWPPSSVAYPNLADLAPVAAVSPSPSASGSPSASSSASASATASSRASRSPRASASGSARPSGSPGPSASATLAPSATATATATPTGRATRTPRPATATATTRPTATIRVTATPRLSTVAPTRQATPTRAPRSTATSPPPPTATATLVPTAPPTFTPTATLPPEPSPSSP